MDHYTNTYLVEEMNADDVLFSMNVAAGPELAAAVTNAGGLGVIGGLGYTPKILRQQVSCTATNTFGSPFLFKEFCADSSC